MKLIQTMKKALTRALTRAWDWLRGKVAALQTTSAATPGPAPTPAPPTPAPPVLPPVEPTTDPVPAPPKKRPPAQAAPAPMKEDLYVRDLKAAQTILAALGFEQYQTDETPADPEPLPLHAFLSPAQVALVDSHQLFPLEQHL